MFEKSDRVQILPGPHCVGLPVPFGTVVEVRGNGGLVLHDDGKTYGWAFHEMTSLEPERDPAIGNFVQRWMKRRRLRRMDYGTR